MNPYAVFATGFALGALIGLLLGLDFARWNQ